MGIRTHDAAVGCSRVGTPPGRLRPFGYGPVIADATSFLDAAGPMARHALLAAARVRRYPKGSLLFAEGDTAHDVLILQSGSVKVVVSAASGREVVLDVLGDGAVVGELSALDGGPRSATAYALEPTEVLALAHADFRRVLEEHPAAVRAIITLVVSRLRDADRRQLEFGANDAIGRLCQRLLELRRRYGVEQADGRILIELPFSQTDLASWAGLSREAVVKALRSLRALGWIDSEGRTITIVEERAVTERAAQ